MLTLNELNEYLKKKSCDYEIIRHDKAMLTVEEGSKFFDIKAIAPTLIVQTERGLIAMIVSAARGRVDFEAVKQALGFTKMKMADRQRVLKATGYSVGSIPFIGHGLDCIFDRMLLGLKYMYGGTGDDLSTLKIRPGDVVRLGNVIGYID
jgi:prolyl-tRNA editing enzyme YbaK/EbsC (Cys-tRNA(Pro) deacylase)